MKLDRRELLRQAGLGSIALASLPTLVNVVAKPAEAVGQTNFTFVVVSKRVGQSDLITVDGCGKFHGSKVEGGGTFTWFVPPPTPNSLVAFGTWEAKRLLKFSPGGTFGTGEGGILDLDVRLVPKFPSSSAVIPATLRVVCTIGLTGLPEGIVLTLSNGVSFEPIDVGITLFTAGNERAD